MKMGRRRRRSLSEEKDEYQYGWTSPTPSPQPGGYSLPRITSPSSTTQDPKADNVNVLNPLLIAIIIALSISLIVVSYCKIFKKLIIHVNPCHLCTTRDSPSSPSQDMTNMFTISLDEDPHSNHDDIWDYHVFTQPYSYGLDDAIIRSIPLCIFKKTDGKSQNISRVSQKSREYLDCAVCLVAFQEEQTLRVLPKCGHLFHIGCIDVWLRSHATCPLCRATIVGWDSNNNSLSLVESRVLNEVRGSNEHDGIALDDEDEVSQVYDNGIVSRSYSFESEICSRGSSSRFSLLGENNESPWRFKKVVGGRRKVGAHRVMGSSPLNPSTRHGLFSRASLKSPFRREGCSSSSRVFVDNSSRFCRKTRRVSRARGGSLSPPMMGRRNSSASAFSVSEHGEVVVGCMTSPLFAKRSSGGAFFAFAPSRLRAGDPEALLSPDRFNTAC